MYIKLIWALIFAIGFICAGFYERDHKNNKKLNMVFTLPVLS